MIGTKEIRLCVQLADNVAESWLTHSEREEHIELMPSIHKYTLAGIITSTFGPYFEDDDRMAEMQKTFKLVGHIFLPGMQCTLL